MTGKAIGDQVRKASEKLEELNKLRARIFLMAKGEPEAYEAQAGDMVMTYPLMHSLLFAHFLKDGPEEGATLTLWGNPDGLGGVFNIKPWGVKAFFNGGSLVELLGEVEHALGDPEFKWRMERKSKRYRKPVGRQKH